MSDTPTPEQVLALVLPDPDSAAVMLLGALAAAGFRVYPEPGEDTHPTPSHSATMRELEQTRAERDAAVARGSCWTEVARLREGIEAVVREIHATHYQDPLIRTLCVVCGAADGSWPCAAHIEADDLAALLSEQPGDDQ